MKLVVFSEKLWPEGSGGELATYLILKLLASAGELEVEVYTGTERPARVPGASVRTARFLRAPNKVQLFLNIAANRHLVEKIVGKADVVYVPRFSYPVIPIAKRLGRRVVVHLHGYQPVSYTAVVLSEEAVRPMSDLRRTVLLESRSGGVLRAVASALATPLTRLIRRWVGMADRVVCVSRRHEEVLLRLAPEYVGKTAVVYNPPPEVPRVEKKLSERPTLLYVGGDSYAKGFHVLLAALRVLGEERRADLRLVLTNRYSKASLRLVEGLRRRYGLDVQVLGRLNYGELLRLHSEAWALLFPSIWEETFGYAVLESMLLGTIPIAARVGGIPEIVSGTPGESFLVEPGSPESLAAKVLELASLSKDEVLSIGEALKRAASARFDGGSTAEALAEIFLSLS